MSDDNSKIISINSKPGFTHKKIINPNQKLCLHKSVLVCEETRTIECEQCGISMDPFSYLRNCCYEEDNAFKKLEILNIEVPKLQKRYNNLIVEIARLKKIRNDLKNNSKD